MKTLDQILRDFKMGESCALIDGRDAYRLARFVPAERLGELKFLLNKDATHIAEPLTEENVLRQLKSDLDLAFDKAINQRGISSSLMYEVIKMWMWVLDDPLADSTDYAMYGMPLYKAVAEKYGFEDKS